MKDAMNRRSFVGLGVAAASLAASGLPLWAAQTYPVDPIDVIVPFGVGGGTDIWVRALAEEMAKKESLGVPLNIRNIPGAASLRGTGEGATAKPDGYTLTAFNPPSTPFAWYISQPPFDISKFVGLSVYVREPGIIIAAPDSGIETIQDLQKAYQSGKETVIASQQKGTLWHIVALLMKKRSGFDWKQYVSYKGTADIIAAIMRREVKFGIVTTSSALDAVHDKKIVPLALTGVTERLKSYPDVPTLKEAGFDPIEVGVLRRAVYGPGGLADDHRTILEKALSSAQNSPLLAKQYASLGLEPAHGDGAEADKAIQEALATAKEIDLKSIVG